MIDLETKEDVLPICPHCSPEGVPRTTELRTIWMRSLRGILGKRYVYFCPNCRKVLGVSHRKGFWMG